MLRACNIPEKRRSLTVAKALVTHLNDVIKYFYQHYCILAI